MLEKYTYITRHNRDNNFHLSDHRIAYKKQPLLCLFTGKNLKQKDVNWFAQCDITDSEKTFRTLKFGQECLPLYAKSYIDINFLIHFLIIQYGQIYIYIFLTVKNEKIEQA